MEVREEARNEVPERGRDVAVDDDEPVVVVVDSTQQKDTNRPGISRLQAHHPIPPIQVVPHNTSPLPTTPSSATAAAAALASLNSRNYTNRISLLLFLLHLLAAAASLSFLSFKAIQSLLLTSPHARHSRKILRYWLPPIEASSVLSVLLAFAWQRAVRFHPSFMIRFILYATPLLTLSAGVLLLCFSLPATDGLAIALLAFSIGSSLYACWTSHRLSFAATVLDRALRPAAKFPGLDGPAYLMLTAGFLYVSVWCLSLIGALNVAYPPLIIIAMILSLSWIAEVMRNVANLTASRVLALYYLRGMQSSTQFSFQRAVSRNLGSASLGSLFVPTIEGLRIIARGLNLLEGEDEFMFSCAHCCLHMMEAVFRYGNSWAFVHVAAYGRGFVAAAQSTWGMFEHQPGMEALVDSDITSAVCFLAGVSSGAVCCIAASAWTFAVHRRYTATVSLLAFWVGYLMTRIGMALPQACVACYYVCYAENPGSRLFDSTIPDRLSKIRAGRDVLVSTPRFPRRLAGA